MGIQVALKERNFEPKKSESFLMGYKKPLLPLLSEKKILLY